MLVFCQCFLQQAPSFRPTLELFPRAAGSGVPKACFGWSIARTAERNSNPFPFVVSTPFSSFSFAMSRISLERIVP